MEETSTDAARCDSCDKVWALDALHPIHDIWSRVKPGGVMPIGDCPDPDCGALCYPTYGYVHDLEERLATFEDVVTRLLDWATYMGGWDASVWEDARRLLGRHAPDDLHNEEVFHDAHTDT
jgi:hypothetical protein